MSHNSSQITLNLDLLELSIHDNERLVDDVMNVTEQLQSSLEHEANDHMHVDPQIEKIEHCNNGETRDQRRPVKERLGYRKEKTPVQNRLRSRNKIVNNAQCVKKLSNRGSCSKYSNKQFHVKRIYYDNEKQATPGKIMQNMHKKFDMSVPPIATSEPKRTRPPASSRPAMPATVPTPTYTFPPRTQTPIASCNLPSPAPVPPPIYNIPPPKIYRPLLTDYMVKSLAADWIATATLKTGFTFKTGDVEKAINDLCRL